MPIKKFRKNWLCLILVFAMFFMMIAPVGAAVPVGRQSMLIGFHNFPGAAEHALLKRYGATVTREFSIIPSVEVDLPAHAISALSRNTLIDYIEPNFEFFAIEQTTPWGINRIQAPAVWDKTTGSGVIVAVLDTGVGPHTDLPAVQSATNTIDGSGNNDGHGHGTHVAGTVAALNNTYGVVGAAPLVTLYSAKVLSDSGSGTAGSVAAGIDWAAQQGANIINMSLGSGSSSQTIENACNAAYSQGILLVAAAGNSGNRRGTGDNVIYPAKYESVIAVAATDSSDKRAYFSSTGPAVELSAPGVSILSTYLNNGYATASGTSMASPHVAGVAALVWAADKTQSNVAVRQILRDTAQDLGMAANHQGYGLVRADLAVAAVNATLPTHYSLTVNVEGNGIVVADPSSDTYSSGTEVTLTATATDGWEFTRWEGDFESADPTITITMNDNKTLTAVFTEISQTGPTLTVNKVGDGTVEVDNVAVTLPYVLAATTSTSVELTAVAATNWEFEKWEVDGNEVGDTDGVITVEMDGDKTAIAYFKEIQYTPPPGDASNISVETDKPSYSWNSWVNITVTLTDYSGVGIAGETVMITVMQGDGTYGSYSVITGDNGVGIVRHRIRRNDPKGTWVVEANFNGLTEDTTFQVQ
ncbi:MAG: S8 family peptidase [Clostridiales bacterium]|jgi:hypothetical protein|nr:S8 family peptidase [Clostridiales bacterium]